MVLVDRGEDLIAKFFAIAFRRISLDSDISLRKSSLENPDFNSLDLICAEELDFSWLLLFSEADVILFECRYKLILDLTRKK